jgi:hypothetical protein
MERTVGDAAPVPATTPREIHPWVAEQEGRVRFGIFCGAQAEWPALFDWARDVERLGFDSLWVGDHPLLFPGDCWTILAALAGRIAPSGWGPRCPMGTLRRRSARSCGVIAWVGSSTNTNAPPHDASAAAIGFPYPSGWRTLGAPAARAATPAARRPARGSQRARGTSKSESQQPTADTSARSMGGAYPVPHSWQTG